MTRVVPSATERVVSAVLGASTAVVLAAGCGTLTTPTEQFLRDVATVEPDRDTAYVVGEGIAELYEDGGDDADALGVLVDLGYARGEAAVFLDAVEQHLVDTEEGS